MRPKRQKDGPPSDYNADLCRTTQRMRARMVALLNRIDALEAELVMTQAEIATERAGMVEYLEGPEAKRDVMLIAQNLLNEEMLAAAALPSPRGFCDYCGGLGRGMTNGLLVDKINKHCAEHGLEKAAAPMEESRWPNVLRGYQRNKDWLRKPPPERERSMIY